MNSFLIWTSRVLIGGVLLLTILPLFSSGFWVVQLCDFPRVQLTLVLILPLLLLGIHFQRTSFRREHAILVGLMLLLATWQMSHLVPYTPLWDKELPDAAADAKGDVRVLVVNLKKDNTQFDAMIAMIQDYEPDLLLLIEFNEAWAKGLSPISQRYPQQVNEIRDEGLGIALWSRLPVKNGEIRHLVSDRRASIFATIELKPSKQVRFVGLHPTPPGLKDSTGNDRRNSRIRDAELVLVADEVADDPDARWIVAGDFNDVAWSATTELFKELSGLKDPRIGRELLTTYHQSYPLLRYPIDHVFFSEDTRIHRIDRVVAPGSDHFAVFTVASPVPGETPPANSKDKQKANELVEEGKTDADKRNVEPGVDDNSEPNSSTDSTR
ncbi:endonuclease/exonuclease/phosphatase family protein [Thalassoroseus pseudoceratinae]|uniref:endonuclease/exonuclease/phosphatase family protein n=1 Tax=Thalassoroseus pseudoceratinae TaxID=2713176 RepID=UPI0014243CBB|nr:endonuclease/exonuclease/phosphatase family protein [Thalassoroseus pseudoceratinae]